MFWQFLRLLQKQGGKLQAAMRLRHASVGDQLPCVKRDARTRPAGKPKDTAGQIVE